MGAMRQERFLISLWREGWRGLGFTCGGFLHQTARAELSYYPPLMDRLHLRWFCRIWSEPKLFWRYFALYPLGMALFLKDWYNDRLEKVDLSEEG
jgi:N-acetylglucosaminyldiphosphoundecaprenol N-acetyl-beta-D-mannosaminyltransferase